MAASRAFRLSLTYLSVSLLLALYFVLAVTAITNKSTTFDEILHLTSGYSYWQTGDYRLHPENGNLPQRWAAVPIVFGDYQFPALDQAKWHFSDAWAVGDEFFHDLGNNLDSLLWRGRAMIALLGVALGALVFFWSKQLFGLLGAFISLIFYTFCPTLLAHGSLATSDMAAALFFTAALGSLWWVMHRLTLASLLACSLAMGGLFISKFSAPIIIPVGIAMLIVRLIGGKPLEYRLGSVSGQVRNRMPQLAVCLGMGTFVMIFTWLVIWCAFSFRYEMMVDRVRDQDHQAVSWGQLLARRGIQTSVLQTFRDLRLLPEAYLYGMAHTLRFADARSAFLNGAYSTSGWPSFFPYAFLVKTTLPLLGMLVLALLAAIDRWRNVQDGRTFKVHAAEGAYATTPIWAMLAVYWLFAVMSHLNIGHRHLLPIYPLLMILVGGTSYWFKPLTEQARSPHLWRPYFAPALVLLATAWHVTESTNVRPHYLAYFNQLAGGPSQGYRHLVDSSLDWGQDLPGLSDWLADTQKAEAGQEPQPVYLSYFGTGRPAYYGINAVLLRGFFASLDQQQIPQPLMPGIYCFSNTTLQSVYNPAAPGPWNKDYESAYQQLAQLVGKFESTAGKANDTDVPLRQGEHAAWVPIFWNYENLRLARLCAYVRNNLEPIAQIGYSINIYRISSHDLQQAMAGPPPYH